MTEPDTSVHISRTASLGRSRCGLSTRSIIDEERIASLLDSAASATALDAKHVIQKSLDLKGLEPEEAAVLLQSEDPSVRDELYRAAGFIKDRIYGNRLVVFAPLYLSNLCSNNCLYCGFRRDNRILERRLLNQQEIAEQVRILEGMGHKRLLLECGESPGRSPI